MNRFSIKDIENLTGIKAHTLRIWEQRYGILQPKRTTTNIRYYDAQDLKLALRIALLNNYGYKISHIHAMNDGEITTLIQQVNDKDFKLQVLVNDLLEATIAMDIDKFEKLLNEYLRKYGIEQAVEQLIFNFLDKIGILWMTDRIYPSHEHMVSNVIYRKLAAAIEALPPKEANAHPSVLLFLPEGEIHDLGLMYVQYLLRKFGNNPIYLGPNSPLHEVKLVVDRLKPDYLYLHLTSTALDFDINKYFPKLQALFPNMPILVSGRMLKTKRHFITGNIQLFHSLKEVRDYLVSLK